MPVQTLGGEDPLEEEMATHFSILALKIPWVEKPGGLHTVHGVAKSQTWLKWLTTLFWRGVHGRKKKKIKVLQVTDKSSHEWWLSFQHSSDELHSPVKKWYKRKSEYWWAKEMRQRCSRGRSWVLAPHPAVFSTLEGSFKRKPEDLLPQQTDKWQPAFLLPSHFELRDVSVKMWVFIQNTDSQTLNWAWGSVLFFKKKSFLYLFDSAGCLLLCGLFPSCREQGLHSNCSARASHCGGSSCCRAQAPERSGFSSCGAQA